MRRECWRPTARSSCSRPPSASAAASSIRPKPEDVTEAGAQWISPKQPRIARLVKEFGLKTFPNHLAGKSTLIVDGKVRHFDALPFPALSLAQVADVGAAVAALTAMAATVPVEAPWNAPKAAEWDGQTAESWIRENVSDPVARSFLAVAMGGPVSVLPTDISLLHYLYIAAALGGPLEMMIPGQGVLRA